MKIMPSEFADPCLFSKNLEELGRLLAQTIFEGDLVYLPIEQRFFVRGSFQCTPLSLITYITDVIGNFERGNIHAAHYAMTRLGMFTHDLQIIERHSKDLLQGFRKEFKKISAKSFYGVRFEVDVCATFIDRQYLFVRHEHKSGLDAQFGDFLIKWNSSEVFAECTSAHLSKERFDSFTNKILSIVNSKSKKPYCHPRTVLLIDLTNIWYHLTCPRLVYQV